MATFDRELNGAMKQINTAVEKAIRGAAIELFSEIVKRTPVGNPTLWAGPAAAGYTGGSLRGNWQTSLRSPNYGELAAKDAAGGQAIAKGAGKIKKFKLKDKSIFFTNNLPYADRVEHGWSKQRPEGMVRVTVKQFKPIIEKIARIHKV